LTPIPLATFNGLTSSAERARRVLAPLSDSNRREMGQNMPLYRAPIHRHRPIVAAALGMMCLSACTTTLPEFTAHDVGQYAAVTWQAPGTPIEIGSYWDRVRDLNLAVATQKLTDDLPDSVIDSWAQTAQWGADQQKKLLLCLQFWDGEDRYQGPMRDIDVYWGRLQRFLDGMQSRSALQYVQGIVLAEENVDYGGRPEVLAELYRRIKDNYDVAVWQWWSPTEPTPSSGNWLPSDGWIINSYFLPNPAFRQHVRKYFVAGMPVVIMPWATSDLADFPPMTAEQWQANNDQLDVAVEFNLPVAFYWTKDGTCYFGGDRNAPGADEIGKINQWVWNYISRVQGLPANYTGESTADQASVAPLDLDSLISDDTFSYQDDFRTEKCIDDASMTGFRDLIMNGETLSARGYLGRPVNNVVTYRFQGDVPVDYPSVSLAVKSIVGFGARVEIALSADGNNWPLRAATRRRQQPETLSISSDSRSEFAGVTSFWVRVTLLGPPGSDAAPTVSIDDLSITASVHSN
jgi:hypothetical protein